MYAVIKTGSKQHKVTEGEVLSVEKLDGEKGSEVVFNEVLMVSSDEGIKIGKPFIDGVKVFGEIIAQSKGPKIHVYKMKRRKGYKKKAEHRQKLTNMKITKIAL